MANTGNRYHWTKAQKLSMRRLYTEEGYSLADVALKFGCQSETIRYHLRCSGLQLRRRGMQTLRARNKYSGVRHHGWKGGRSKDHGYYRLLLPTHPNSDTEGYYPEHRYVVEQHLLRIDPSHEALDGGFLRRDWIVHHKNGNKSDNRIENLEAMPRHQHHSWIHYQEEIARLREEVRSLRNPPDIPAS